MRNRVLLDAYSRRHEAQKIYLRQAAAQNWIGWRESTLNGERPHSGHRAGLEQCDAALRAVSFPPISLFTPYQNLGGVLAIFDTLYWSCGYWHCNRSLRPSQTVRYTLICSLQTTNWGAGRKKTQVYGRSNDGFGIDAEWAEWSSINLAFKKLCLVKVTVRDLYFAKGGAKEKHQKGAMEQHFHKVSSDNKQR